MTRSKTALVVCSLAVLGTGAFLAARYFGIWCEKCGPVPGEAGPAGYSIEQVADGLEVPWSVAFASESRILVAERPGRVRAIVGGALAEKSLKVFPEAVASDDAESGLMGLAVDPDYEENKYVYASLTYAKGGRLYLKVVRMRDAGEALVDDVVILDETPAARFHAGSRIKFGPDGKLYVTTGDASTRAVAQDLSSLAGKILRLNSDGTVPDDNPFEGSLIYSYGHRNPQGIDWDEHTGALWESEHGPSVFDGPAGGDEINLIQPGGNYGWPVVSHEKGREGMEGPKTVFTPAIAPAGILVYSGDAVRAFKGRVLVAGLKGEGVYALELDTARSRVVTRTRLDIEVGRVREIVEGPDGTVYFTTSNRDGRGSARQGDDKIYRIVPAAK